MWWKKMHKKCKFYCFNVLKFLYTTIIDLLDSNQKLNKCLFRVFKYILIFMNIYTLLPSYIAFL